MKTNDGGPAYPHEYKYGDGTASRNDGMTLRDCFAAAALQAHGAIPTKYSANEANSAAEIARACYFMADAMLKERCK